MPELRPAATKDTYLNRHRVLVVVVSLSCSIMVALDRRRYISAVTQQLFSQTPNTDPFLTMIKLGTLINSCKIKRQKLSDIL